MSDFRLEVFYTVARRLSFTKAAAELFITQPAVTKHIHELEEQYKAKLFERNTGKKRRYSYYTTSDNKGVWTSNIAIVSKPY